MAMRTKKPLVFICYAKKDKQAADRVYDNLCFAGATPWIDSRDLKLGDSWETEIEQAVAHADAFVVCLSKAFNDIGYRQQEVRFALSAQARRPLGQGFIIPYVLEPCDLPAWLKEIHVGDPTSPTRPYELIQAINKHCRAQLGSRSLRVMPLRRPSKVSPDSRSLKKLTTLLNSSDREGIAEHYLQTTLNKKAWELERGALGLLSCWNREEDASGKILENLLCLFELGHGAVHDAIPHLVNLVENDLRGHMRETEFRRQCLRIISLVGDKSLVEPMLTQFLPEPPYTDISIRGLTRRNSDAFVWAFPISLGAVQNNRYQALLKRAVRAIFREDIPNASAQFSVVCRILNQPITYPHRLVLAALTDWVGLRFQFASDGDLMIVLKIKHGDQCVCHFMGVQPSKLLLRHILDILIEQSLKELARPCRIFQSATEFIKISDSSIHEIA